MRNKNELPSPASTPIFDEWSLKNPWTIAALIVIAVIACIMLATFQFGMSRDVASVMIDVLYGGFWACVVVDEIRKKHYGKALVAFVLLIVGVVGF